jgi:hypothetical protein
MSQVEELKEPMIASSTMKRLDFFIKWHLTERCKLHCRHCYQGIRRPEGRLPNQLEGICDLLLPVGEDNTSRFIENKKRQALLCKGNIPWPRAFERLWIDDPAGIDGGLVDLASS